MLPRFILLFILVIVTPAVSKSARGISKISIKNKAFVTPGYPWAPSKKNVSQFDPVVWSAIVILYLDI